MNLAFFYWVRRLICSIIEVRLLDKGVNYLNPSESYMQVVKVTNSEWLMSLLGTQDKYVKLIEDYYDVAISNRGEDITIQGQDEASVLQVRSIYLSMLELLAKGFQPKTVDFVTAIKMAKKGTIDYFVDLHSEQISRTYDGKPIYAKNYGQLSYVQATQKRDIVFGIGPAGTGKTYLAVVLAVQALKNGQVKRIILTRPAVEAGERLGFLPGDLKEKVDPYLRPIYDALYSVLGKEHTERLIEREVIEIAPLAYMRGRTLDDAFVILDEAQNTTIAQMKMFLTRLGFGSKMIVNGDHTQIDLMPGVKSGLIDAEEKLSGLKRLEFVYFDAYDVVRHPAVADIIRAYSNEE